VVFGSAFDVSRPIFGTSTPVQEAGVPSHGCKHNFAEKITPTEITTMMHQAK
jgi:hypothetical protein